jgi:hypothetical protein
MSGSAIEALVTSYRHSSSRHPHSENRRTIHQD